MRSEPVQGVRMRNLLVRLASGLMAVSILVQSAAQARPNSPAPNPQPSTAAGPWFADWSAPYCTVSIGNIKELALSIWYVPGSSGVEIYFIGDSGRFPRIAGAFPGPTFDSLSLLQEVSRSTGALFQMAEG